VSACMAANTLAMRFPGGTVSAGFFATATFGALVAGAFDVFVAVALTGAPCGGAVFVVGAAATFCVAGAGAAGCVESPRAAVCGSAVDVGAGFTAFAATAAAPVADAAGVVGGAVPGADFAAELSAVAGFAGVACFALAARAAAGVLFGVRTITMPVAIPRLNPNAATNGINRRFIMSPAACSE